jgi:hypothetical protein
MLVWVLFGAVNDSAGLALHEGAVCVHQQALSESRDEAKGPTVGGSSEGNPSRSRPILSAMPL